MQIKFPKRNEVLEIKVMSFLIALVVVNYLAIKLGDADGRGDRKTAKAYLSGLVAFAAGIISGYLSSF